MKCLIIYLLNMILFWLFKYFIVFVIYWYRGIFKIPCPLSHISYINKCYRFYPEILSRIL